MSAYSEYINYIGINEAYTIFRIQTDKSIIVRLKCVSYCISLLSSCFHIGLLKPHVSL